MTYLDEDLRSTEAAVIGHAENRLFHDIPEPPALIRTGLCNTCYNCGNCTWQHSNKIECEHFE